MNLPFLPAFNLYVVSIRVAFKREKKDKQHAHIKMDNFTSQILKKKTYMNAYIICTLKWFWCIYTCMSPNYIHIHVHTYNIYNTNILSVYMFHSNGLGKIFSLVESRLRLWSYFVQSHSYFIIITMSFNFLWKMKKKILCWA